MANLNGYAGKILDLNLSDSVIQERILTDDYLRDCIGGAGLGAKLLLEQPVPAPSWDNPENPLMFLTGPLSGTKVHGSGTICVVTRGALNNMAASSQANGFFGAYLRQNGYDGLVIKGRASDFVYLLISEGKLKIKSANNLIGMDTYEIQSHLTNELNDDLRKISVYGIGPAGENLVKFACIAGDYGHVAAHNGIGAVMGSKNLKAIAIISSNGTIQISDEKSLNENAKKMFSHANAFDGGTRRKWGTARIVSGLHALGQLPVKNYTTNVWEDYTRMDGKTLHENYKHRVKPCWRCGLHSRWITITDGEYAGFESEEPEYEAVAACSSIIDNNNQDLMLILANTIDRLGLDVNETGWMLGWLMEIYDKKLISKEMLGGVDLKWGNVQGSIELLKKISNGEEQVKFLSEGVKQAAQSLGGNALECAVYTESGNTPRGHDHRAKWSELLDTCMSNTGTIEATGGYPDYKTLGVIPASNNFDPLEISRINAQINGRRQFEDFLGICRFTCEDLELLIKCVNATTGWELNIEDVKYLGLKAINRLRIFNILNGFEPLNNGPSRRYGSTPVDGPAAGISFTDNYEIMRDNYWELMGWDKKTGYPTMETLKELELNDWIAYLLEAK